MSLHLLFSSTASYILQTNLILLSYFLFCFCNKTCGQKQLPEKGLNLAHKPSGSYSPSWQGRRDSRSMRIAHHILSVVSKQRTSRKWIETKQELELGYIKPQSPVLLPPVSPRNTGAREDILHSNYNNNTFILYLQGSCCFYPALCF